MSLAINIKTIFSNTRGWLILCLSAIAIGLSLSKPLISLGLTGLFLVWIIDGDILGKIKAFFSNKTALILSSIYLISLLGLLYTSNFDFAFDDLRRKISIFALPFLISGFSPITKKELDLLLKVFVLGVISATLWSLFVYLGGLNVVIVESRALSRFNSHIRFGLEIALAAFLAVYFFKKETALSLKILWISTFIWMVYSLILFNLFTGGIVFLFSTTLLIFLYACFSKNKTKKLITFSLFFIALLGSALFINNTIQDFYQAENTTPLNEIIFTKNGENYQSIASEKNYSPKENGYYINENIAWSEFSQAWNTRSSINFNDKDLKGQNLQETLVRFISSKGQRKDQEAIENLTDEEVSAIEKGIPNYKHLQMNSFSLRIHKIIWEYDTYVKTKGQTINGHSILMRWAYWTTAIKIIKKNLFIGVGTGDVQDVFNQQYDTDKSPLLLKNRLRGHNQYLTYTVSFGLLGLCYFLFCLFNPFIKKQCYKNYNFIAFFSIFLLSMLSEDTLETQVGVSFFAFFNTIFTLSVHSKEQK